ncbi:hypothetical protein ACOQFV_30760 [Nocardiopsis changdeensis]|uniref:Uncharacterized protein n=1 Tax=Nocardiopsis changdeensis TaxID=2831969 RepID=A0ABX8BQY3_9ACTN|nr:MULTISPECIES: hypothetical protein [Nocardiopsis]QUX24145.1 hypothetical protein KGD84_07505 [Nocardiopsis changdeensis]QYX34540.1 hypothetical protein K1J57_16965 [Nocardiopsis sp. MT53]
MSGGGINVSVIAPAAYLADFVAQDPATVHHVAAQRVLNDPSYRAFFQCEAERGASIIVDNGVFDLGRALPAEDLVRAARAVHAEEIILPDVMGDGPATIKASDEAAARIQDLSDEFRLCAVVHAADDEQWLRCYDHFASCDYAGAIALPASRRPAPPDRLSATRTAATAYLKKHGLVNHRLVYRLLGLGRTGHLELVEQREHDWIASVDGAAPVLLGAMGIAMLPEGPYSKPKTPRVEELGTIPPERFPLIKANIAAVRRAADCPLRIPEAPA